VRAGVEQVLAFQINARAAEEFAPALGVVERGGAADVFFEQAVQLGVESRIGFGALIFRGEFAQGIHEGLGDEHAAKGAEVTVGVGKGSG
jgi:hypothetical protein